MVQVSVTDLPMRSFQYATVDRGQQWKAAELVQSTSPATQKRKGEQKIDSWIRTRPQHATLGPTSLLFFISSESMDKLTVPSSLVSFNEEVHDK